MNGTGNATTGGGENGVAAAAELSAASAEQEARKQTIAKLKEEAGGAPLIHTGHSVRFAIRVSRPSPRVRFHVHTGTQPVTDVRRATHRS